MATCLLAHTPHWIPLGHPAGLPSKLMADKTTCFFCHRVKLYPLCHGRGLFTVLGSPCPLSPLSQQPEGRGASRLRTLSGFPSSLAYLMFLDLTNHTPKSWLLRLVFLSRLPFVLKAMKFLPSLPSRLCLPTHLHYSSRHLLTTMTYIVICLSMVCLSPLRGKFHK